jgi:hypothetical protein
MSRVNESEIAADRSALVAFVHLNHRRAWQKQRLLTNPRNLFSAGIALDTP